jgi:predicted dehydrogenase
MADAIRVGIIGGGWPGKAHAKGYEAAHGFKLVAVADLIPARRKAMMEEFKIAKEYADARELIADPNVDAVSVCLPNDLHAPVSIAALKAGKHVVCESAPAATLKEAKQIESAAAKAGKVVLYAMQRRFGGNEQASRQAIAKGYVGAAYHARAAWTRTRGVPLGTGWYTDKSKAGGGAMIDVGIHMLDLAWSLIGQPAPTSVFAATHRRLPDLIPADVMANVEDAGFALIRFDNGASIELAASWGLNQPPSQNGASCRVFGDQGAVDVYTGSGAVLYRSFTAKGESSEVALKLPKTVGHGALMRHFKDCIAGTAQPLVGPREGFVLMQMIDAIYRSAESGKSVQLPKLETTEGAIEREPNGSAAGQLTD